MDATLGPEPAATRRVATNAALLALAYALPRALTLASAVVAARVLGAATFGLYSTAAALAVVASIAATLGMQPLLVREIARSPAVAPELVATAHAAKLATVALMGLVLLATPLLHFPSVVLAAAALLGVGYAVGAFVENLAAYFQGMERMHVWTQASVLAGVVSGGGAIALVLTTRSLLWLCAAPGLGQAAGLAWLLRSAPASVRRPPLPSPDAVASLLRRLAPFALAFVATTLYYRLDVLLLSRWRPPAEVGLYGAAYRFLDVTQALALAGAGALLPPLSRGAGRGSVPTPRILGGAALAAAGVAAVLLVARGPLVRLLYGEPYAGAAPLLAVLAPAVVPLVVNMFALTLLAAADAMRRAAAAYLTCTACSLALNLALIPRHGAAGAAVAALVSESLLAAGLVLPLLRLRREGAR
jgi:O-antigen/teichoic acid export membrane protein